MSQARVHDVLLGYIFDIVVLGLFLIYFDNIALHLTAIWLEYHFIFQDMCFALKFGGMGKKKIQFFVMLFLSMWLSFNFDLNFICELKVMNT